MKKLLFLLLLALPAYAQNVIPIVNGNVTINPTTPSNSFKILVNQAVTVNIINPPGGFPPTVNVLFQQDGTGHAVTYGNTIVNGPTVSSSPNAVTSGSFQFDGSTNTWYGVSGGGTGGGGGSVTAVSGGPGVTVTNSTSTPNVAVNNVFSATAPNIDPRNPAYAVSGHTCLGNGTDTATQATGCFQNAVAQMEAHGGNVLCPAGTQWTFTAGGVLLKGYDTILGPFTSANGINMCEIALASGGVGFAQDPSMLAAQSFASYITIRGIYFTSGGLNPIDIPYSNQLTIENIYIFNQTGCGLEIPNGERYIIHDITVSKTAASGWAALCTGDFTKSVYASQLPPNQGSYGNFGIARASVSNISDLGSIGSAGFYDNYLWWGGNTATVSNQGANVYDTEGSEFTCFFSCAQGVFYALGMFHSSLNIFSLDHVGISGTPEPYGIYVNHFYNNSKISRYDSTFNPSFQTVSMYIGQMYKSTLEDDTFNASVDNVTTFGLDVGITFATNTGVLHNVSGGVYFAPGADDSGINIIGSSLITPTNLPNQALVTKTVLNNSLAPLITNDTNTHAPGAPLAAGEFQIGNNSTGTSGLAFQWGGVGGGYRHWLTTNHVGGSSASNYFDFYVNSGTGAGDSSAPGTGNTLALSVTGTGIIAPAVTASSLTPGNCVQASTGGLLTTTSGACASGTGTVTTSGSPAANQVALFSSSTAITGAATDTTTTHALFATAGAPAFRALATGDLPAGVTQTICSGTVALGTGAISSGAAATTVTATCTGLASTDNIMLDFNASPLAVTGYIPTANGMLTIIKWPTTNTINVSVINNTASSITPGAITLNYRVTR